MPIVVQLLMIAAMLAFAGSFFAARAAWPKFRNLERRGTIGEPIGDTFRGNPRALKLLWATKIPDDRPQLLKVVVLYRVCQVAAVILMFASLVVWNSTDRSTSARARASDAPPPVTLTLADQDQ